MDAWGSHDYITDLNVLNETELPPIDKFYSSLNNKNISIGEYRRVKVVWEKFVWENMWDYTLVYLKREVLLLADIFQKFRGKSMKNYGLDPAWFYTAPGLSYDAALKVTGVWLDLISDSHMYLMI